MSRNTWPGGAKRALSQCEHERWNASNYPGTKQMCFVCDQPTGACEEDGWTNEDGEDLCKECYDESNSEACDKLDEIKRGKK